MAVEATPSPELTEVDAEATRNPAFRDSPPITSAGMLARRDARAQAYKEVFTAFPADVIGGLSGNAILADAIRGLLRNAISARR